MEDLGGGGGGGGMRAERTTFASVTTAGGSEIAKNLLVHVLGLQRRADLLGQAQEHLAANLNQPVGISHGREYRAGVPSRVHEDYVIGAEHFRCVIAEVADRHDLSCGHLGRSMSQ